MAKLTPSKTPLMVSRPDTVQAARTVTLVGAAVNIFLIGLKFAAGIIGHSQALVADAVHSISDSVTDAVVLFGARMGSKPPDPSHPFGHARLETLTTSFIGVALIGSAVYLGIEAVISIHRHTESNPNLLAVGGAAVSIVMKEALYHYTVYVGRRIKSQMVLANAWHHRSDAFSSVAALLGVTAAYINPAWHFMDAFAALFVSFFIARVGIGILMQTLREFIDTAPPPRIIQKMERIARSVDGIAGVHDLRVRTSGGLYQMEIHIDVDGQLTILKGHQIAKAVEGRLKSEIEGLDRVIVHVDPI